MKIKLDRLIPAAILALALTACPSNGGGGDEEGGPISGKFRFTSLDKATAPRRIAPPRSAAQNILARTITAGPGYTSYIDFYDSIGEKVESITPGSFKMGKAEITYFFMEGNEERRGLINLSGSDFANPVSITAGTFLPVTIHALSWQVDPSMATFTQPAGIDFGTHAGGYYWEPGVSSINGNEVTLPLKLFDPGWIISDDSTPDTNYVSCFGYDALPSDLDFNPVVEVEYRGTLGQIIPNIANNNIKIIVPFSGITIPKDASAVRYEIIWDLNGIIERYKGHNPSDSGDDIFVLKKNFWDGLDLRVFIE